MRYAVWGAVLAGSVVIVVGAILFSSANNNGDSGLVDQTRADQSSSETVQEAPASPGLPSQEAVANDVHSPYTDDGRTGDGGSQTALIVLLAAVVTALILSAATNIFLFRWRREAGNDQISIVPKELLDELDRQRRNLGNFSKVVSDFKQEVGTQGNTTIDQFEKLKETFLVLQGALDEKEKEIKRLKRGYDAEIFRRFLTRFIRVDNALADEIDAAASADGVDAQAIGDVRDLLQDALHECGVSEFSPKIGESVRDAFGIADNYKKVVAETPGQELTIAEVIEPGFMIRTPEGSDDCIKPAKVAVYVSATGSETDG